MGKLTITSPIFKNNDYMPKKYSCQGEEINPPLKIENVPKNTKSLALIMTDPDTPIKITFTHWIICDLDPKTTNIEENDSLENAIIGKNSIRKNKYLGPCPPWGTHRYIFKLYALNEKIPVSKKITKRKLLKLMKDHIIAEAELIGLYKKS